MKRTLAAIGCVVLMIGAAWVGSAGLGDKKTASDWTVVAPGIARSPGRPAGYALLDGEHALLIDAPHGHAGLERRGIKTVDLVLLTHYHHDACAAAAKLLGEKIKVRAPRDAAEWLTPAGVRKYWQEALPLRSSRTAYLVAAEGFEQIDCSLQDGQKIAWRGWTIQVVDTPGHARAHVAFAARKGADGPLAVFCGGALAGPGKMWAPYTTDWDHWTDAGLRAAAKSLRKLAALKPAMLLPAYGPVITKDPVAALLKTAETVEEAGFLKSYERYSKQRLGNAPQYRFLAKEQAGSNGSLPWSRVSKHLFYTGNTWVLTSAEDRAFLVVDPWGKRSAEQIAKLRTEQKLGALEVVMFSHAHYDHYDGIYELADRKRFEVWMLDRAATPVAEPYLLRAPFLDTRPVTIDRRPKEGETLTWREYRFRFHHLPGQTEYTMGVETTIDGKRCLFTGDNWFHQDLYSGTGGWMGLNRSTPSGYAASARKVIELAPEWVLAEHGGAFEYNAEDFRRRVTWGEAAAAACDALSPSGDHRHDWNPHRVHVLPVLQKAKPGATLKITVALDNVLKHTDHVVLTLEGRGFFADQTLRFDVEPGQSARRAVSVRLDDRIAAGRHVFIARGVEGKTADGADAFFAVDIEP